MNLKSLSYHPLEGIRISRPVDRIRYFAAQARGQRVLDLGAYDETEIGKPHHSSWRWLHAEIAREAAEVLGVDASPSLREKGALATGERSQIVWGDVSDLAGLVQSFKPTLITAGELIEHTPDTLIWLQALARAAPGVKIIISTPNSTSLLNIALALIGRENCHQDHLCVYSFKTLATLSQRIPIDDAVIIPYFYDAQIFKGWFSRAVSPLISLVDWSFLRPVQYIFPLSSFGLILTGKLGAGV